jgi:hypothetical protein
MACNAECVPPIAALVAITAMESFFPEKPIDRQLGIFRNSFHTQTDFESMKLTATHLARGWQTTVDLVYSILAIITLLASRALLEDIFPGSPVFWILLVSLFFNVVLLVVCANIGPEDVVAVRIPLRFGLFVTWRKTAIAFIIISNITVIAAIIFEIFYPFGHHPSCCLPSAVANH